jgi:hypothetical protein
MYMLAVNGDRVGVYMQVTWPRNKQKRIDIPISIAKKARIIGFR